eukprot:jgi/Hompol1/5857/HPOL_001111-RA
MPHSSAGPSTTGTEPFQFSGLGMELQAIQQQMHEHAPAEWAAEFQHGHDRAYSGLHDQNFEHFERAFDQAQAADAVAWEGQFAEQQSWESQFMEQNGSHAIETHVNAADSADAMAKTADLLLSIVEKSTNPKFKQSKFVNFVQKLRDQDIKIVDNKVVDGRSSSESLAADGGATAEALPSSRIWANDFLKAHGDAGINDLLTSAWEEDFAHAIPTHGGQDPRAWASEFAQQSRSNQGTIDVAGNGAAEGDWVEAFAQTMRDADDQHERSLYEQDWADQFKAHASLAASQEPQLHEEERAQADTTWESLSQAWDDASRQSNLAPVIAYQFTPSNPYLHPSYTLQFLKTVDAHKNLSESILALEAAVQRDPTDANAWRLLGLRQQENESDVLAISALRQCTQLDPNNLDAWLALSVSYTNENLINDAYDALMAWISSNPRYEQFAGAPWMNASRDTDGSNITGAQGASTSDMMDRHAAVSDRFIAAASSRPNEDLDEDVQIALGILFNINGEYHKAVDCFEAALSKRPNDYMLWNKLGATLANSNDPSHAMDSYFNALQINPSYIRARYNLAIACIQIGQYREAAEHLLGAASIQKQSLEYVMNGARERGMMQPLMSAGTNSVASLGNAQSAAVWSTLRLLTDTYCEYSHVGSCDDSSSIFLYRHDF